MQGGQIKWSAFSVVQRVFVSPPLMSNNNSCTISVFTSRAAQVERSVAILVPGMDRCSNLQQVAYHPFTATPKVFMQGIPGRCSYDGSVALVCGTLERSFQKLRPLL